ncbi:MAG: hypothetical protein RLZZ371_1883 [Pseudomonadota bacterium]
MARVFNWRPLDWTRWLCLVVAFLLWVPTLQAQSLESVLAPGELVQGHAKLEGECKNCHVKFDRQAQSGVCMSCHKEIGSDIRSKTGLHGRQTQQVCNECHTDHKGRKARIVQLNEKSFDHAQTDYGLSGKHKDVACAKCHVAGRKHREAPSQCVACHRKDDKHKGSLGEKCADCHEDKSWKEVKFDHSKTRFALVGKHEEVKCASCHKSSEYRDAPRVCLGCHKKDDDAKGHKGLFGDRCDTCHEVTSWKKSTFNHDQSTKYKLVGKHRGPPCSSCHSDHLYKVKLSQECVSCHRKDDKHKSNLGENCASCHSERGWKEGGKFDHQLSSFPLRGKHATTDCKNCHKTLQFKEAPSDCYSCHAKDDRHQKNLGNQCVDCHAETNWKDTSGRFSHEKTRFPLRNAHADGKVKCSSCHQDLTHMRHTDKTCLSCHKKDDKHEGQLSSDCGTCHNDKSWKGTSFNHAMARFALAGRHLLLECKSCHLTLRYKDARSDCYSCHQKHDKHKLAFGKQCESCHNVRAWVLVSFDHDKQTSYPLEGAHRQVACEKCHTKPAATDKRSAPIGSKCVSCHQGHDIHSGAFGQRCELCHQVQSWKKFRRQLGWVTEMQPYHLSYNRGDRPWMS